MHPFHQRKVMVVAPPQEVIDKLGPDAMITAPQAIRTSANTIPNVAQV